MTASSQATVALTTSAGVGWGNLHPNGTTVTGTSSASFTDGFSDEIQGTYSGIASATSAFGSISATAHGTLASGVLLQHFASANARFEDEMTIAGAGLSGSGFVVFTLTLTGSSAVSGNGGIEANLSLNSGSLATSIVPSGTVTTVMIPITFGTSFDLQMQLSVNSSTSFGGQSGDSNNASSATITGMEVFDPTGTLVIPPTQYTVSAASGTDYKARFTVIADYTVNTAGGVMTPTFQKSGRVSQDGVAE